MLWEPEEGDVNTLAAGGRPLALQGCGVQAGP